MELRTLDPATREDLGQASFRLFLAAARAADADHVVSAYLRTDERGRQFWDPAEWEELNIHHGWCVGKEVDPLGPAPGVRRVTVIRIPR